MKNRETKRALIRLPAVLVGVAMAGCGAAQADAVDDALGTEATVRAGWFPEA